MAAGSGVTVGHEVLYPGAMPDPIPPAARSAPSTARNRQPILDVLKPRLPRGGLVLEIASGAGEHAVYNAAALPGLTWQPTDPDPEALTSISAWRAHAALPNLLAPLCLDASAPDTWPVKSADAILNINMIHISSWAATVGLMAGAESLLPVGGVLFLYGPYLETDVETAPSNLAFDDSLRRRNPAWGIRPLDAVVTLAAQHRLDLAERIPMPANNLILVFRKR
jgi:hypothetical protein